MNNLRKIINILIYLAFLLPLVFTSRTMYPWHFGKTIFFQILVEILIFLSIIYFSFYKDKIFKFNLFDYLIIIFAGLQLLSSIFGVDFNRSFWGDQTRAQGVFTWWHFFAFYFILRLFIKTKKDWYNLGLWIVIISFLSSLVALIGRYLFFFDNIITKTGRFSGMIGNPIFFSSYLIIPIFFGIYLFLNTDKKIWWRWFILFTSIFNFLILLFTETRGAYIGFILGIFFIFLLFLFFSNSRKIKIIFSLIILIFIIIFTSLFFYNKREKINLPIISTLLNISVKTMTADTRLMAWGIAFHGVKEKPIFGWGPENYQDIFDKYYNYKFLKYSFGETTWDKPHNFHLEILCNMGILGFISYLSVLFSLLFFLIKIIKNSDNNERNSYIILAGGIIAYIGQNSFAFETSNSLMIWISTFTFINFLYNNQFNEKIQLKAKNHFKEYFFNIFIIIIFILTPFLIYKNFIFYTASTYAGNATDAAEIQSVYLWKKDVQKVLGTDVPFLWEQGIFTMRDLVKFDKAGKLDRNMLEDVYTKLLDIFNESLKNNPSSYLYRFWLSQLYGYMGEYIDVKYYENSNSLLIEAYKFSPDRQQIPLLLAKNYLFQKRNNEAINLLNDLVEREPDFPEIHWFLGVALVGSGQEDKGIIELEKGETFGMGYSNNILYLIDIYSGRKEYKKIISLYENLIAQDKNNASYYANIAATYAAIGDKENTLIYLNKAVELDPSLAEETKIFLEKNNIEIQ